MAKGPVLNSDDELPFDDLPVDERLFFAEQPAKPAPVAKTAPPSIGGEQHYHGHRERLRNRFRENGDGALADYEILELLLFRLIPRRDTKPIAKALLDRFGTLAAVFGAPVVGSSVAAVMPVVPVVAASVDAAVEEPLALPPLSGAGQAASTTRTGSSRRGMRATVDQRAPLRADFSRARGRPRLGSAAPGGY